MRSLMHANSSDSPSELAAGDAGLLIALPSACVAIAGCAYHLLHQKLLVTASWGPYGLIYSPYLTLTPAFAFCGLYSLSKGAKGLWAMLVGTAIALVVTTNFRGSFYWPGTFEMAHKSVIHTVMPMSIGIAAGGVYALYRRVPGTRLRTVALAIVIVAFAWTLGDANRDIGMVSLSPYTLHLALGAAYIGAVVVALLVRFAEG